MQAHQCDLFTRVKVIGVRNQRRVVKKLIERFGAIPGIHRCVDQFPQVLDSREGFGSVLFFQERDVTGAVDEELENIGRADRGRGKGLSDSCAAGCASARLRWRGLGRRLRVSSFWCRLYVVSGTEVEREITKLRGIESCGVCFGVASFWESCFSRRCFRRKSRSNCSAKFPDIMARASSMS